MKGFCCATEITVAIASNPSVRDEWIQFMPGALLSRHTSILKWCSQVLGMHSERKKDKRGVAGMTARSVRPSYVGLGFPDHDWHPARRLL
jgi:hypothetical protein